MLTDRKIQKYLLISALLVISVTCLFLSAWNSYIRNSGNNILPVIFFCISLFMILYLVYTFLFYSEKSPEQDESVTGQNKDDQQENKETQYLTADDIAQRIIQKTIKGHNKGKKLLQQLAAGFDAMQAILFTYNPGTSRFEVNTSYAITNEATPQPFIPGEGLHGQAVLEKKVVQLSDLPENFRIVSSGLGKTHCRFLYLLPVLHDDKVIALLEFSTLKDIGVTGISVLNILMKKLGDELNPLITGSDEK